MWHTSAHSVGGASVSLLLAMMPELAPLVNQAPAELRERLRPARHKTPLTGGADLLLNRCLAAPLRMVVKTVSANLARR